MTERRLKRRRKEDTTFRKLIDVGIALSSERNHNLLMERILLEAKSICNADGGTLYLLTDDDKLSFEIVRNDTMNIAFGGTTGKEIPFEPLNLFEPHSGKPNHTNVASHAFHMAELINITNADDVNDYDFTGAQQFDEANSYKSKSFLTVPLKNYEGNVIGVLQLINARDFDTGKITKFQVSLQPFVEAMASQAAVALDNQILIQDQRDLLESFIQAIAGAIDAKSPYTGGHCQRVPVLAEMLAAAACKADSGPFRDFNLSDAEMYELHIAGWLHDCGKVTTPEYIVDKSTKLETIYDRIESVYARFEILKRDAEIAHLKAVLKHGSKSGELHTDLKKKFARLDEEREFIKDINIGGEYLMDADKNRIKKIAQYKWRDWTGTFRNLLDENEVYNLSIERGTLTSEERQIINDHIVRTIEMLDKLHFPKHLKRVPEYAGGHHEKMDGSGYPKGLKGEEMSLPARMMAIADIFEALTAADRPYKNPKSLSESLEIMALMVRDRHIDGDLFSLFLESGVFLDYAHQYLLPHQIDDFKIKDYLS